MPRPAKLEPAQIAEELKSLPGWSLHAADADATDSLAKEYRFKDFDEAWAFMERIAPIARKMDHHPDWRNVYNRVEFRLSTHDAGGVTALDIELARSIERQATA